MVTCLLVVKVADITHHVARLGESGEMNSAVRVLASMTVKRSQVVLEKKFRMLR